MRVVRIVVGAAMVAVLAGCATAPEPAPASSVSSATSTTHSTETPQFKACLVVDAAGFTDGADNQAAHEALVHVGGQLGIRTGEAQAHRDADYAGTVNSQVDAGCKLIVLIGTGHLDAALAGAQAHPGVQFALLDAQPSVPQANLKPLLFDVAPAAFLAGYLAASQAQNSTVAIPADTTAPYLNGVSAGVVYYNQAKGADVQVVADPNVTETGIRTDVRAALSAAITEAVDGNFTSAPYLGTLAGGGVDIAPLPAGIDQSIKDEIATIRAALIDGSIAPPAAG